MLDKTDKTIVASGSVTGTQGPEETHDATTHMRV